MSKYMVLEKGESCYTEFLNKEHGDFDSSDDAVLIDTVEANSKQEAIDKIINSDDEALKWREFDDLFAYQIVDKDFTKQIELVITYLEDSAPNSALEVLKKLK